LILEFFVASVTVTNYGETWMFNVYSSLTLAICFVLYVCLLFTEDSLAKILFVTLIFNVTIYLLGTLHYNYFWGNGDSYVFVSEIKKIIARGHLDAGLTYHDYYVAFPCFFTFFVILSSLTSLETSLCVRLFFTLIYVSLFVFSSYLFFRNRKLSHSLKAMLFTISYPLTYFGISLPLLIFPWVFALIYLLFTWVLIVSNGLSKKERATIATLIVVTLSLTHPLVALIFVATILLMQFMSKSLLIKKEHIINLASLSLITILVTSAFTVLPLSQGNYSTFLPRVVDAFLSFFEEGYTIPRQLYLKSYNPITYVYSHFPEIVYGIMLTIFFILIFIKEETKIGRIKINKAYCSVMILLMGLILIITYGSDIYQGVRVYDVIIFLNLPVISLIMGKMVFNKKLTYCVLVILMLISMPLIYPNETLTKWANLVWSVAPEKTVRWLDIYLPQDSPKITGVGLIGRYVQACCENLTNKYEHEQLQKINEYIALIPLDIKYFSISFGTNVNTSNLNYLSNVVFNNGIAIYYPVGKPVT
jgi:hypothetical protein